jgi:cytidylate kinase
MQIPKEELQEVDMVIDKSNMEIETNMKNIKKSWMKINIKEKHLMIMKIKNIVVEKKMKIHMVKKLSKSLINSS